MASFTKRSGVITLICCSLILMMMYSVEITMEGSYIQIRVPTSHFISQTYMNASKQTRNFTSQNSVHENTTQLQLSVQKDNQPSFSGDFDPFRILVNTRLRQYETFSKLPKDFTFKGGQPANGKHDLKAIGEQLKALKYDGLHWYDNGFLFIKRVEYYKGELSKGGSYIHGVSQSSDVFTMCAYEDFFNGTYLIQCPIYSDCAKVDVRVLQINYRHFKAKMEKLDKILFKEDFCTKRGYLVNKPESYWEKGQVDYKWHSPVSDFIDQNAEGFCKRLNAMGRLYFIGASHIRYHYLYTLYRCHSFIPDLSYRLVLIETMYGKDAAEAVNDMANESLYEDCSSTDPASTPFKSNLITSARSWLNNITPPDQHLQLYVYRKAMLKETAWSEKGRKANDSQKIKMCRPGKNMKVGMFVQTGSWDLSFKALAGSREEVFPRLEEAMKKLSETKHRNLGNLDFVIMGPPPCNPKSLKRGRSNAEIELYNQALEEMAVKYDLGFFNSFRMLLPRYEHNVNTHYAICNHKFPEKCRGQAGVTTMQAALLHMAGKFNSK